ncbi:hypothetical protein MMUC44124_00775 [Mycolicibacterium mucogenicum DSM 44124]|nr:hypothetical protein MMUC44124_00775 [Mycolicibacterium mucogenicum DSM 44124]
MHTLYDRGRPIAMAERHQRCCMEMAFYPAHRQKQMRVESGCPNPTVQVLR